MRETRTLIANRDQYRIGDLFLLQEDGSTWTVVEDRSNESMYGVGVYKVEKNPIQKNKVDVKKAIRIILSPVVAIGAIGVGSILVIGSIILLYLAGMFWLLDDTEEYKGTLQAAKKCVVAPYQIMYNWITGSKTRVGP